MHGSTQSNESGDGFVHPEFGPVALQELVGALSALLSDGFVLFVRTKHLQWQLPGPDLRDRRSLLAKQARAVLALVDRLALRIRVLGGLPTPSLEDLVRASDPGISISNQALATPRLQLLGDDNKQLLSGLREAHGLCEEYGDVATSRLLAAWIDEAESRVLHLFEMTRPEPTKTASTREAPP